MTAPHSDISVRAANGRLEKRSLRLGGKRTSLAIEPQFWLALEAVARRKGTSVPKLLHLVCESRRPRQSLASAVRVFLLAEAPP